MIYYTYPGFRNKALTISYDDGLWSDVHLLEILNRYGIRGTFNLNSGCMTEERRIGKEKIPALYKGHEITTHGVKHLTLARCPMTDVVKEILEDRQALEELTGEIVCGHAYPNGSYSPEIKTLLPSLGIHYARTATDTGLYTHPQDFYEWNPTCHHNNRLMYHAKEFLSFDLPQFQYLFYVWGHSYEFDRDNNWDVIEEFCKMIGGREDIWYATNAEVCHYLMAVKQVHTSVDEKLLFNGSGQDIYLIRNGENILLRPGELQRIHSPESHGKLRKIVL